MVKIKESPYLAPDGTVNLEAWLQYMAAQCKPQDLSLLRHACVLSQLTGEEEPTLTGVSCLQQGLVMAEILLDLQLDGETIAAALVYNNVHYADLNLDDVREHLGEPIAQLVQGTMRMDAIRTIPNLTSENHAQLENVRKMLLAMVQDMRVVVIKLAERTAIMRSLDIFDSETARQYAKETMDIYAPLANRLGIGQLKWELEDRSLRYLEPNAYQEIAAYLQERRIDREQYIEDFILRVRKALTDAQIKNFEITGRAKHIYSIYRKMQRKKISFEQLFDLNAMRILVENIEDCYSVLSIVHGLWQPIPNEFDDYIATPKSNGYRSIHTAVIGPNNKNVEIQIRTQGMHKESEHGVAAHWRYKEGGTQKASYEAKIAWLRQVLAWQKELAQTGATLEPQTIADDHIYVFTPTGEIVDLPQDSTPLDFAYYIHSEVGHRCRGAKVNGNIVPLTYILNTGEQIEILTAKHPNPSRDWINPHLGYLKTARAKAKVHHWFKLQDFDKNVSEGRALLDRELQRLALTSINEEKIAHKLHFKNHKDMLAALGCGDVRLAQVLGAIQTQIEFTKKTMTGTALPPIHARPATKATATEGIKIGGVGNLLTHTARCCKPIPGDPIIGFITKGRGVAIHRQDCVNILNLTPNTRARIVEVNWGTAAESYPVDIIIEAHDRPGLVRDITLLLANERYNIASFHTVTNRAEHAALITLTLDVPSLTSLSRVFDRIKHIPNVIHVKRQTGE